jgi:inosine-uridine nucleoside N-ribohydrolase
MDFRNSPSNKYWVPYIYARPQYIIIATPFGSQHVPLPLDEFVVAVVFTLLASIVFFYFICPEKHYCCCCCRRKKAFYKKVKHKKSRDGELRKVLIITDIGRDIDDTLALCALNGLMKQKKMQLVGVVTSGGNGVLRAQVVRGWLRRFGLLDEDVPVAACTKKVGQDECFVPKGTPLTAEEASLYEGVGNDKSTLMVGAAAANLILEITQKYSGQLEIIAIAPLTPLAEAIRKDGTNSLKLIQEGIKMLHIQGQCKVKGNKILPDFAAYNLREDKDAARLVFDVLQDAIPFRILGKHAAYQIQMTKSDFQNWDKIIGTNTTDLLNHVKENLNYFRKSDPINFTKLYKYQANDNKWFEKMKLLSHPYDPLCVLAAFKPKLFRAKKLFAFHRAIGNTSESNGVINVEETRTKLVNLISLGLK